MIVVTFELKLIAGDFEAATILLAQAIAPLLQERGTGLPACRQG